MDRELDAVTVCRDACEGAVAGLRAARTGLPAGAAASVAAGHRSGREWRTPPSRSPTATPGWGAVPARAAVRDRLAICLPCTGSATRLGCSDSRTAARRGGWEVGLWALDTVDPDLARFSVGSGPGSRTDLLNKLAAQSGTDPDRYLVFADDDVEIARGELPISSRSSPLQVLDLAQPAHAVGSHYSHRLTAARPWSIARRTGYVEIGPLIVVAPAWRDRIVPFPAGFGMGWGLEMLWSGLQAQGCRLGIVDTVRVRHLERPAVTYDRRLSSTVWLTWPVRRACPDSSAPMAPWPRGGLGSLYHRGSGRDVAVPGAGTAITYDSGRETRSSMIQLERWIELVGGDDRPWLMVGKGPTSRRRRVRPLRFKSSRSTT